MHRKNGVAATNDSLYGYRDSLKKTPVC